MTVSLGYHEVVNCSTTHSARRSIPATWLALIGIFSVPLFVATSRAQISSTSSGSAHSASVAPPTAMTVAPPTATRVAPPTGIPVGRGGFTPPATGFTHSTNPNSLHFPNGSHPHDNGKHHHRIADGTAYYPYVYGVPVPYAADPGDAGTSENDDDDAEYQGGPTIFDRRGAGADSYVPPVSQSPTRARDVDVAAEDAPPAPSDSEPPPPPTTLVFKDGHQLEVNNYAVVNQTLYDLTPGHPRKILLADLDLSATQKQNDDRGVVFQLPPSSQAN